MPTSNATATWSGGLKDGKGHYNAGSGTFAGDYGFGSRFGGAGGTNPEELIAAAHASCFSMALSGALEKAGNPPERVQTSAACTVEKVGDGFTITKMALTVRGKVPGIDQAAFQKAAEGAKAGCPVSRALAGIKDITVTATLE